MEATVTLNKKEVEAILQEHVSKKFKNVKSVKLNVLYTETGFYGEKEAIFKNAECVVEM